MVEQGGGGGAGGGGGTPGKTNGSLSLDLGSIALELLTADARPTVLLNLDELTATPMPLFEVSDALSKILFRKAVLFENDAFRNTLGRSRSLVDVARLVFNEHGLQRVVAGRWRCSTYLLGPTKRIRAVVADVPDFVAGEGEETGLPPGEFLECDLSLTPVPGDTAGKNSQPRFAGAEEELLPKSSNVAIVGNRGEDPLHLNGSVSVSGSEDVRTNTNAHPELFFDKDLEMCDFTDYPQPNMDWTAEDFVPLPGLDAEHYRNLRNVDWAKTSLGPTFTWDTVLKTHATSLMTHAYPTALYWGPDYTMLYNKQWRAIAQNRDPVILGMTFAAGWPELNQYFRPILDKGYYKGEKTTKEAECLFIRGRHHLGAYEEAYFNFIICPVIGKSGKPVGILEQAFEITKDYITDRRMSFLRKMGDSLANVRDLHKGEFLTNVLDAFKDDLNIQKDSPFMAIYKVVDPEKNICHLVDTIGIPIGGHLAPEICTLDKGGQSHRCGYFAREMEQAMLSGRYVLKELDPGIMEGVEYRGFNEPSRYAVIIPIQATMNLMQGFMILGINPRRPFDDDYKFFINLLRTELASTSGRARLLMDEIRKGIDMEVREAEMKQAIETKKLLEKRTEELKNSELLFTKTAEILPVGLALMDPNGVFMFTNNSFHELTTLSRPRQGLAQMNWRNIIFKDDMQRVWDLFDSAIANQSSVQWECRCGDTFGDRGWKYWVSCNMEVHIDQCNGVFTGYMMTLVDVTSIKLAEEYQKQLSIHAVERRRQQENFIDIFSHELRNPFSATLQCADGILSSVMEFQLQGGVLDAEDIIDAASTILVCVQHQMRIIDDVLTLSKLDSMLLSVVPVDVQIHESVVKTFKIFQSELQVKDIKASFEIGEMYDFLKVTWLKCDPSRFNQILVNLLTNAIKFTSLQRGPREISVRLDAARDRPPRIGRIYLQHSHEEVDSDVSMTGAEWGTGDPVYILVTVKDSGIGISEKWQAKLFNRFEQVPKTHITYGGSGLGLFICRKLCRIQGGEIGVYSQEGKGSTFAFYIQARRTDPPPNHIASHRSLAQDKDAHLQSPLSLDFPHLPKSTRGSSFPLTAVTSALYDNDDTFDTLDQSGALNTSNVGYSRPSGAGRTASETFVPHSSATPATRATLSQFKPIKSPSIQPVPRGITVRTPYRVLIVEDNVINQEVLRRQLRREGCVAYVANNGQEALNFIARSSFAVKDGTELDVVLMDMEMPIMDGNTATRRIRGWEREGVLVKHVPIMGISANARSEQVSEMTKAGMDDAISKPFRIVDLLQRFNSLMGALEENGGADGGKSLKGKRRVEKKEEKKGKQQAEEPKENGKGGLDNISWEPLPSVLELQKSPSPMNPLL